VTAVIGDRGVLRVRRVRCDLGDLCVSLMLALGLVLATARSASAHIGSPDVYLDGQAGPYRLFVTVRPPRVIPGVADVEILTTDAGVRDVRIVPLPLVGAAAQFAPVPDVATRSPEDPKLFTGHLWMMTIGEWQVRVTVDGDKGTGTLSVPVPTLPQSTLGMNPAVRGVLIAFMLLLSIGFIVIVAAMFREARLEPGAAPGPDARRRGRIAGAAAAIVAGVTIFLGNYWWTAEASTYAGYIYKPLQMTPSIVSGVASGSSQTSPILHLSIHDPGWIFTRRVDDFEPDHDHLMHLFVVSPDLDRFWHLHPAPASTAAFEQPLPDLPAGSYELFADVVHRTGVPETITASLDVPATSGTPLSGDDSAWTGPASNGRIAWVRDSQPLTTKRLTMFTFRVEDASGQPATDLELYMGMPGHAIFVRKDRRVFAHVHPAGSAPMASLALAGNAPHTGHASGPAQAGHETHASIPPTVTFPYGFPEPGDYRIFVQVKRAGRIETGVFDTHVD
jgi:hypothetical protein